MNDTKMQILIDQIAKMSEKLADLSDELDSLVDFAIQFGGEVESAMELLPVFPVIDEEE